MSKKNYDNDRLQREGFDKDEIKRLRQVKANHLAQQRRSQLPTKRRLDFHKWLYQQGKLSDN